MKYSLTCNISNASGNTRDLSEDELSSLTDGDTSSGSLFLLSGDEAVVVCDLNNRYNLDSFKYYYTGDGDISISVAEFQDNWSSISYNAISGGVQSFLGEFNPRWLKISHSVITGSGNMYEVGVYNDDVNILFGPAGNFSSYGLDASGDTPTTVAVYNSTVSVRDINVFVGEGVETEADNFISASLTSSGIFYTKRGYGLYFPRDFSWDSGSHNNTINSSGYLTLSGTAVSGTYYSSVFNIEEYSSSRVFWEYSLGGGGYIDYREAVSSESCIGVRKYNYAPTGAWSNGVLPDDDDPIWSISSGSLPFIPITNNSILDIRNNYYIQFVLSISGTHPNPPFISKAGVEGAFTVVDVPSDGYKNIYVSSVSGTLGDKTANLICWYRE